MVSKLRNKRQSAYQIKVAESEGALTYENGLLWDIGKQIKDQNSQLCYAGNTLSSDQYCYYKIRVWDENDMISD